VPRTPSAKSIEQLPVQGLVPQFVVNVPHIFLRYAVIARLNVAGFLLDHDSTYIIRLYGSIYCADSYSTIAVRVRP